MAYYGEVPFSERSASDFGRAGLEYSRRSRTEFFVLQTEFSFSVRFDRPRDACSVGDLPHCDVQEDNREVESLLTRPIAIANREARTLNVHFKDFVLVRLITNASQTRSQTHPVMVCWWCTVDNRLFGLAAHNCLSLSLPLSFSSPSYFPSFSKHAKRKTKLRFAERDQVQDAGPTLALDEAPSWTELDLELLQRERPRGAVRQDVAEIFSKQTKLSLHQISESKPAAWPVALAEFVDWHLCTVDVPIY